MKIHNTKLQLAWEYRLLGLKHTLGSMRQVFACWDRFEEMT